MIEYVYLKHGGSFFAHFFAAYKKHQRTWVLLRDEGGTTHDSAQRIGNVP